MAVHADADEDNLLRRKMRRNECKRADSNTGKGWVKTISCGGRVQRGRVRELS
jgi:hypothetical protein